jgi:uncharacterized coiled-coil protein SlyX
MAEISKQALKVENNQSFPNNNNGAITPAILRDFNVDMIDSLVDEQSYNIDSASWNQQIDALEQFSASAAGLTTGSLLVTASAASNVITFTKGDGSTFNVTVADTTDLSQLNQATASLQQYTASANIKFTNLETTTASLLSSVSQLNASSASQQVSINNLNSTTASLLVETQNLELFSASALVSISNLNASSASQQTQINQLIAGTGSYATTGSNTFTGPNTFTSISASSFVSASTFVGDGSKLTGITASIALPILDEGIPQGNAFSMNFTGSGISAVVVGGTAVVSVNTPDSGTVNNLTASFNAYTASTNLDLAALHQATASLQAFTASFSTSSLVSTSSFNSYTQSNDQRVSSLEANTASVNISIAALNTSSASQQVSIDALNVFTASQSTASIVNSINELNTFSASALISISNLNTNSASVNTSITNLNSATSSLFTSASLGLTTASFSGNTLTFTKGDSSTFGVVIPDVSGSAGTTVIEVVYTGESITKGDPLYISGSQGANPIVFKADASNPAKMPVTFISNETIAAANTTNAIVLGLIEGIDLTGYTAGQTIYVAEGGGYSTNLPSGSNSITQLLGVITKAGSGGKGLVLNPGPAQLPGLDTGLMWVGGTTNQPVEITTASFASSASFNSYTSSNDAKVNSLIAATGSYATTGSNEFNGNQTITGSVYISSSATVDLRVEGQIFVSSSATGGTTAPKLTISGSAGTTTINRNSITTRNLTQSATLRPEAIINSVIATNDEIGFAVDAVVSAIAGWTTGPAMYVNNPTDTFPAVFGFQNKANYTDGRVAVLTPLSASAGFTASLQNGYAWVGNSLGQNTQVATSSFGGALPADLISSSAQITALGFVSSSITASSIVTASVNLNTITFTKGDSSTFALTVDTGSGGGGGAAFPFTGDAVITGSLLVSGSTIPDVRVIGNIDLTGSMRVQPITLSVAANTASIDMNRSNYFILNLPTSSTTHVAFTNIIPGESINLLVSQSATVATGSIAFAPNIYFPGGNDYVATATGSARDIVSFITFNTAEVYATNVKNLK